MPPSDAAAALSLRHLRAFIAVADCGTVSKAAEQLYRAQSAVTRSIFELEDALNVPLYERRTSGMRLTIYGEALLRRAQRAAAEFDLARRDLHELCGIRRSAETAPVFTMQGGNRRLAAFAALTELHHMPDVARHLGITQPAVSAAIRELEDSLHIPLFKRTPHGLLPTPAADALARRIKLAFSELRHAADEIASLQGVTQGQVRFGALPLGRTAILPRAVARLLRAHPAVRVSVIEGPFETLSVSLRSGDLDFIFGALRSFSQDSDLEAESLFEDQLSVVVRAGHPLTRQRKLSLRDLQQSGWVLNSTGTPARALLESAFVARGLPAPANVVETSSLAMTRGLLLETDYLTAVSLQQIEHELRFGMLAILTLDLPETARRIGLMRRRNSMLSPAAQELASAVRQVIQEIDLSRA